MEEILKQDKSKSNKEKALFEKLLAQDLSNRKLKENEIITGVVSSIGKKHVFIDFPAKAEGAIPIAEFKLAKELEKIKVGEKIQILLEKIENVSGEVVISRQKAIRLAAWKKMEKAFENKEEVTGMIVSRCRGGMIVDVESCLCFLPGSQIDLKPLKNFDHLMKKKQTFEVVKLDRKRGNIVVSRRSIMERIRDNDRDELLAKIKEGDIVNGTVKNLTDWGAFIDIAGGIDALLHITDCSHQRINKPSDLMSIGDSIKCVVSKIDNETKKVSVSVKDLTESPWLNKIDNYKPGKIYDAVCTRVMEYGVFSKLDDDVEGLIHSSELSYTRKNLHPGKVLSVSQKIKVLVLEIDKAKKRLSLSYKRTFENPWDTFAKTVKPNDILTGKIKSVVDYGMFISINFKNGKPSELEGLCHIKNVHFDEKEIHLKKFKKGMDVKFVVLEYSVPDEKIQLGIKQLDPFEDPYSFFNDKAVNDIITVTVDHIDQKGVWVNAGPKNFRVLIKKNQLAKEENQRQRYNKGDRLDAVITELGSRKVSLSIKKLEEQLTAEAVKKYGSKDSGALLGEILGPLLKKKTSNKKK